MFFFQESIYSKIEHYLSSLYNFRFDEIALNIEYQSKQKQSTIWLTVNEAEIWRELNKIGLKISCCNVQNLLKSNFVTNYNPLKNYFLNTKISIQRFNDPIKELSNYVELKKNNEYELWYHHLKKWMIRSIRTIFDLNAINKHALILVSEKEGIGKSFFCDFLCPPELKKYYNSNPTIYHEKDFQNTLATNFLVNLDELQQFKYCALKIKSWISQTMVKVRLPYDKKDTVKPRVCSFLGSSNDENFLNKELGYSRWIYFNINNTKFIDKKAYHILNDAWAWAYHLYKIDPFSGELTKEEYKILQNRAEKITKNFSFYKEEIEKKVLFHIKKPINNEGCFMTATEILHFLQKKCNGNMQGLNLISLGKILRKINVKRGCPKKNYGYWIELRE